MRARRKKNKVKILNANGNDDVQEGSSSSSEHIILNNKSTETAIHEEKNAKIINVTIASNLTSKEARKIRKDARRKARKEQKDENLIRFVDEDGNIISTGNGDDNEKTDASTENDTNKRKDSPDGEDIHTQLHPKKKLKKASFPNINELLAQAEQIKKAKEEEEKRKSYQNSIPEEIKNQYVALDCEMVGIGAEGRQSALARVSITNWNGDVILDTFVQVPDRVTDFRTFVSGIRAKDIKTTNSNAMELHACRKKVWEIIQSKILVGHSLRNDFQALMMNHPRHLIRDTARYKPLMRASGRGGGKMRPRKLRDLVKENVGLIIQKDGEAHSSVDDARATMELYKSVREEWEKEIEKQEAKKSMIGKKRKKR